MIDKNLDHNDICHLVVGLQDRISDLISVNRITKKDVEHLYTAFMELQRVLNPHMDKLYNKVFKED